MVCVISPYDLLYRKVEIDHCCDGLSIDAFQDKYANLSFTLGSFQTPCQVLERFAAYPRVLRACHKAHPTGMDMYHAGFRVAALAIEIIRLHGFDCLRDEAGNEYNPVTGHVNIVNGKEAAATWASRARLLNMNEMKIGLIKLPTILHI